MNTNCMQKNALSMLPNPGNDTDRFHLMMLSTSEEMYDLWLPIIPEGIFRFSDSAEHRFFSISAKNGCWFANCHEPAYFQNVPIEQCYEVPLLHGQLLNVDIDDRTYAIYVEKVSRAQMVYHNYHVTSDAEISVGRQCANDIQYDNPYVSRKHAVITRSEGQWTIQDCGSRYGVYINGIQKTQAPLETGDVICIMGLRIIVGPSFLSINDNADNVIISPRISRSNTSSHAGYSYHYDYEPNGSGDSFYNRLPRKRLEMPQQPIIVEGPPMSMDQKRMPLILRMGSSVVMGGTAALAGNFTTLLSSVMFPFLSSKYTDKQRLEYEQLRLSKYTEYLAAKREEILSACRNERFFLNQKYPAFPNVVNAIGQQSHLWERRPADNDFLHLRLGTGTQRLTTPIEYPPRRFELETDKLEEEMYKLVETPYYVDNVPITLSLTDTYVCGLQGSRERVIEYIRQLVLQLASFHSYDEVKLLFLLNSEELEQLDDIRYLPHAWDDQRTRRFIATGEADAYKLGEYIQEQLPDSSQENTDWRKITKNRPFYIVFALNKKLFECHESLKRILQSDEALGISVICAYNDLPKETQKIISLKPDDQNICTTMTADGSDDVIFGEEVCDKSKVSQAMRVLANTRLKTVGQSMEMPKMVTFLEMFQAGRIEQLTPLKRWQENNPVKSLAVPVGIGADGTLFMLDLHEKRQGPHGLVAGTTGSGKSEFIITYILSMAFNFHPDEVAFVLIDYKGGGLTGAFENPRTGIRLPHLVGTITNLDGASIHRSLMSIQSELVRRQRVFNEAKSAVNEGTMDIYTYQKLYRLGKVSEPVPHLFIISDEFAELKQQQPDFMDELISAARIGRSLGVHLILATQKPSGVVNDQIRSNTKFRICLRVQDRADSMDMLKRPEAAELTDTGRFYLQVGYNEYFALGQSAWCGAPYEPQDAVPSQRDDSLEFVDNLGQVITRAKPKVRKTDSGMKQIVAGVKYLAELAEAQGIRPKSLWKADLPAHIDLDELEEEYHQQKSNKISALIGKIDDPENQDQYPLALDLSEYHNVLVVGTTGSGKTSLIKTMILSLTRNYSPKQLNYYILDFSGGALSVFGRAPHCGAFLTGNDEEAIKRFVVMLKELIQERKNLFMKAGVSNYKAFTEEYELPLILLVIDNFAGLASLENGNNYFSTFHEYLRESSTLGIQIVISCSNLNEVSARSKQELGYRIALQLKDRFAYQDVLNCRCTLTPQVLNGRGICLHEEKTKIYHVAIPYPHLSDQERTQKLISHMEQLVMKYAGEGLAKKLPILSDSETYTHFCSDIPGKRIPLGYEIKTIRKISIPFSQLYCMPIYFGNPQGIPAVMNNLVYAAQRDNMELLIVKRKEDSALEQLEQMLLEKAGDRVFSCTADDSLRLCHLLISQITARKVFRNEYCTQNNIPVSKAKTEAVMKRAGSYIREKTKAMMILLEDFYEFSSNLQVGCFDVYKNIFENGKEYNIYFAAGFYPETKDKVSVDMLTKSFIRGDFLLFFGGQYQNQGLTMMPMEYKKITAPMKAYNKFIMKYRGEFYSLIMPCGQIQEESVNTDDAPII